MLDVIGVGVGPFNLSLASLLKHQSCQLSAAFFEQKPQFSWHEGMLMPDATLQVPFLADLVTMVDPMSPFSFLNYLKDKQRLFQFYFRESFFLPRLEYNDYCRWVCVQLDTLHFGHTVTEIEAIKGGFEVVVQHQGKSKNYQCKNLVLGVGSVPSMPSCADKIRQDHPNRCFHSAEFMQHFEQLSQNKDSKIVLIGSGQSAGEIFYKLLSGHHFDRIDWVTRADGFFPMEYTPFGLEHFSPDYMDCFYGLDCEKKRQILNNQGLLYKGINAHLLKQIYDVLYQKISVAGQTNIHLRPNLALTDLKSQANQQLSCHFLHNHTQQPSILDADYVILATGYHAKPASFLSKLQPHIQKLSCGQCDISRDYELKYQHPTGDGHIFAQNMELFSHGVGTPDLGLGAYRAATIINRIAKQNIYQLSQANTFQTF
ncbi:lysine N(6)-hydroxylase/L-ornithine N(5)-oxygenase family protein [Acinetobacter sp. c3-l95]|uniref:lysine N(6)-hydroxylase/L-ornithine N(5)-oxygenase family protein n=1 Tax=Acinetobacter sp. c3-l95 TaxID=3342804 RepID=UPI0035B881BB